MKRLFRVDRGAAGATRDVGRELDLHIELRAREFEAAGMTPDDARRAAIAAFGDRAAVEHEVSRIRGSTVRERARRDWLQELRQDIVVGLRGLRRAPGFTLIALLTLAIGIGANTAIFSVLRSVLLRPLPYPHSEQLIQVWADHRQLGREAPEWLSPPDFVDWRDRNRTFSGMAAFQGWFPDLTGQGDPETLSGLLVSGNFFDVLGVRPQLGRLLTMADDDASTGRVVVLTDGFWRRRFGADPAVIGKPIFLNGSDYVVVGVLPPGFRSPTLTAAPEVIRATRRPPNGGCGRGCVVLRVIGRMKPGVTVGAAQADLARVAAQLAQEYPETNTKVGAWLVPLREQVIGRVRPALLALSGAVAFVLLIGCVNLANLLLVRGTGRQRELGVRAALGAGRGRIVRQLLTENALLALGGGVLGIAIGVAASKAFGAIVPVTVRDVQAIDVDGTVLLFAAAITLLSAAIFGLLPAFHAVRANLMGFLRGAGRETGRHDNLLRRGLVVSQLTLAVVLLVGAGLLLRSFLRMQRVELGYRSSGVVLTSLAFPAARYPDAPRAQAAIDQLMTKLRTSAGIRSAELTDLPVLTGGDQDIGVFPVGRETATDLPPSIWYRAVSPGYLNVMGMRLVAGRGLAAEDRQGMPRVAILNEEAARRYFPRESALGRSLRLGRGADAPLITVVGIVANSHHDGPNQPVKLEMFVPEAQFPSRGVTLVLEPAGDVATVAAAYRQALREVDPLVPVSSLDPIDRLLGESVALPRLYATLVGVFASAALLLAALGVYGVMAYAVAQRQREIGVRLALGAAPATIGRMVLGEGGWLAGIGVIAGLVAAALLGRVLSALLFGVGRFDPVTFVGVPIVLGIATLIACWLPARRAMRLDPLVAIRDA